MLPMYSLRLSWNYSSEHSREISVLNSRRRSLRSLQRLGSILRVPFSLSQLGIKSPLTLLWLQSRSATSTPSRFSPDRHPYTQIVDSFGMLFRILPVIFPPTASQQIRACSFPASSRNFSPNSSSDSLRMQFAPSFLNTSACSSRRTTFIISTPSTGRNRFSIRPRADAAAFTITAFTLFDCAMSSIAIAVSGFTKLIDACSKLIESSTGKHSEDFATAYCPQVPEEGTGVKATFLLTRPHPISPPPFSTTTPLPSKPAMHGTFLTPEYSPDLMKKMSEGLMGAAITLMSTSPSAGFGIGTIWTLSWDGPSRSSALIVFTT